MTITCPLAPRGRWKRARHTAAETGGAQPFSVAFDPTGTRLAVGFTDAPAVRLFDAGNLAPLAARTPRGSTTVT